MAKSPKSNATVTRANDKVLETLYLCQDEVELNDWEDEFISDLIRQLEDNPFQKLTRPQKIKLAEIEKKMDQGVLDTYEVW